MSNSCDTCLYWFNDSVDAPCDTCIIGGNGYDVNYIENEEGD